MAPWTRVRAGRRWGTDAVAVALRVVWPTEALAALITEPREPTALVVLIESRADFRHRFLDSGLAVHLLQTAVSLFALVGPEAEQAHDALDWTVDEARADEVVTTWHRIEDCDDGVAFVAVHARTTGLTRIVLVADSATPSGGQWRDELVRALDGGVSRPSRR